MGLLRPARAVRQLHAQALAGGLQHAGPRRSLDRDHAAKRRHGRRHPGRRPRHRDRRLARHDRARLGRRRVAGDPRAGHGRRHPRAAVADLAGREVLGLHEGDRAPVRQQPSAQRGRSVRLLRARRRLHHHRQRGRREALRDEHPLLAAAPRLHDPAAGRLGLARRGRPGAELPRRGLGRSGERLHEPQHGVSDLEPAARRADAQGRRRHPGARQQAQEWDAGCRFDYPNPEHRA